MKEEKYLVGTISIFLLSLLLIGVVSITTIKEKSDRINELETIVEQQEQEKEVYIKMLEERNGL